MTRQTKLDRRNLITSGQTREVRRQKIGLELLYFDWLLLFLTTERERERERERDQPHLFSSFHYYCNRKKTLWQEQKFTLDCWWQGCCPITSSPRWPIVNIAEIFWLLRRSKNCGKVWSESPSCDLSLNWSLSRKRLLLIRWNMRKP